MFLLNSWEDRLLESSVPMDNDRRCACCGGEGVGEQTDRDK